MGGFFSDTKEKMRLLKIAINEETKIEKLNKRIEEIERQKNTLNKNHDSTIDEINKLKGKILTKKNKIISLKEEFKSKMDYVKQLENAVLSQKQKMQPLVDRYNSLTSEEKTIRKYFGEIQ